MIVVLTMARGPQSCTYYASILYFLKKKKNACVLEGFVVLEKTEVAVTLHGYVSLLKSFRWSQWACTWLRDDVAMMCIRRNDVATTSIWRHLNTLFWITFYNKPCYISPFRQYKIFYLYIICHIFSWSCSFQSNLNKGSAKTSYACSRRRRSNVVWI